MPVLCGYRLNLTYERITGKPEVIRTSEKHRLSASSVHRESRIGEIAHNARFHALRDSSLRCYGQVD
jgi:hypothetical protein